ncbi:hypothetical protein EMCRGX_G034048 [Ephydatia muelleri]|eukprot:Em0022g190a
MEEVDGIIVTALKELGCEFGDSVVNLQQFTADMVVEACVRCLKIINPDFDGTTVLPEAMSARYRMCSTLANACQSLGYQGEIGYQTFLYSSTKEWRKLLMFVLEKLPKENIQSPDQPTGARVLLSRTIAAELGSVLANPWTPGVCKRKGTAWSGPKWWLEGAKGTHGYHATCVEAPEGLGVVGARVPKEVKHYYTQYMSYVSDQPHVRGDVLASLLEKNANSLAAQQEWETEWNQSGLASRLSEQEYLARKKQKLQRRLADHLRLSAQSGQVRGVFGQATDLEQLLKTFTERSGNFVKGSRFQHAEKLQFAKEAVDSPQMEEASEEELQRRREEEINALQEQLAGLTAQLEGLELNTKKYSTTMQRIAELQGQYEAKNKDDEEAYQLKKKTYDLLPNADENIAKLQELNQSSADKLEKLAGKWEEIRAPLVARYRDLKDKNKNQSVATALLLEEMKGMRERMKQVADETRAKDDLYKQLVAEYGRMTKDLNRGAYTRRISEILSNIRRQKEDIEKILVDTRAVQKEINQLSGKLDRLFTVTDEQVFKDAKKDEARRAAYKLLASLRENCDQLVEAIKENSLIRREQRDLEEEIDKETSKKVAANLEKISADLEEMKKENAQLLSQA